MTKLISALLFFIVTVSSCKKNGQKSRLELLTQNPWVMIKGEVKKNNGSFVDQFAPDNCQKDDSYTFLPNTNVIFDPGIKCFSWEQIRTGFWTFAENEEKFGFLNFPPTFSILQLDENIFVISRTYQTASDVYTDRITFISKPNSNL